MNLDENIEGIIAAIQSGKSHSVLTKSEDISEFESTFPLVKRDLIELREFTESLVESCKGEDFSVGIMPIDIDSWESGISRIGHFKENQTYGVINISCAVSGSVPSFFIVGVIAFRVPSLIKSKGALMQIPMDFLPFGFELAVGSNNCDGFQPLTNFIMWDKMGKMYNSGTEKLFETSIDALKEFINNQLNSSSNWTKIAGG